MKIKGVSGKQYVDLNAEIRHYLDGKDMGEFEDTINHSQLRSANQQLKQALVHITSLVNHYGLCRPEGQLMRMELNEGSMRYVSERNYDEKNLGAIAKHVLSEMREKGELKE